MVLINVAAASHSRQPMLVPRANTSVKLSSKLQVLVQSFILIARVIRGLVRGVLDPKFLGPEP